MRDFLGISAGTLAATFPSQGESLRIKARVEENSKEGRVCYCPDPASSRLFSGIN